MAFTGRPTTDWSSDEEEEAQVVSPFKKRPPTPPMPPNMVTAPLNIRKSKLGPKIEIKSDAERFGRPDAGMAMLGNTVEEMAAVAHAKIKKKLDDGEETENFSKIYKHLLASPPSSPGLFKSSSGSPTFTSAEHRYLGAFERQLKGEGLAALLATDRNLHKFENDLTGVRQWWESNRGEWRKRREYVAGINMSMSSIRNNQAENEREGSLWRHGRPAAEVKLVQERLQRQLDLQQEEKNKRLEWFAENEELMKCVVSQYMDIKARVWKLKSGLEFSIERPIAPAGEGKEFLYHWGREVGKDITKAPWFKSLGLTGWLACVVEDLFEQYLSIRRKLNEAQHELEECFHLRAQTEAEAQELSFNQPEIDEIDNHKYDHKLSNLDVTVNWQADVDQVFQEKREARLNRDRLLLEKNERIAVLETEEFMYSINLNDLQHREQRNKAILAMVRRALADLQQTNVQRPNSSLSELHEICYLHDKRRKASEELSQLFHNDALLAKDQIQIMTLLRAHIASQLHHYQGIITWSETAELFQEDSLAALADNYTMEYNSFSDFIKVTEKIIEDRKSSAATVCLNLGDDNPSSTSPNSSTNLPSWGAIRSLEEAQVILEEGGDDIRDFFVSPDIAPAFMRMSPRSKREFLDLVNSFLFEPLPVHVMEAFLLSCEYFQDLFSIGAITGHVSAIEEGWELVDEAPISGLTRSANLIPPHYSHHVQSFLFDHQKKLLVDGPSRDIEEKELFARVNYFLPEAKLDLDHFRGHISYFNSAGIFFQYLPVKSPNDELVLHRIDNGWRIDPNTEYLSLFTEATSKDYIKAIFNIFTIEVGQQAFVDAVFNETQLYEYLEPRVRPGSRGMGSCTVKVTKHRFHLFLRWCDQYRRLFELCKDGEVTLLTSGWGTMFAT